MPIIGLDLGSHYIRAVELEKKKGQILINAFGEYESPNLNLDFGSKGDTEAYEVALKDFFTEYNFSTTNVSIGLNENSVFMRIIQLPKMPEKELKSSIMFQAEQYIPLPIAEINISHQILEAVNQSADNMDVQLVAAKKNILEKYVGLVKRAGLVPLYIEPETLAMGRSLGDSATVPVGTMIVDIGFKRSLIIITFAGHVRFTRSVSVGGDVVTKSITQGLNLDYSQAEEYKKVYGMDPMQGDGKVAKVVQPIIANLIQEIRRANVFFANSTKAVSIKRLILTGGTAQMPGLITHIASNLDMEVELASPLRNISLNTAVKSPKQKLETLTEKANLFSTAIGLALRGV